MEAQMERCRLGLGRNWVKAKTGSHLCQLGWRDSAHSLSRAGTFNCTLTVQPETPRLRTQWEVNQWLQGKAVAAFAWMRSMMPFKSSLFFFSAGEVHTVNCELRLSIRTLAYFCNSADGEEVRCHSIALLFKCLTINELSSSEVVFSTETLKFEGLWKFDKWKLLNQEVDVVESHSVQHNHNQIKGAQCTSGVEVLIRREMSPLADYCLSKQTK